MKAVEFAGQMVLLSPPAGYNDTHDDKCGVLPVMQVIHAPDGPYMVSVWRPSDEDIQRLANGEFIMLTIYGTQHPPVSLQVTPAAELP